MMVLECPCCGNRKTRLIRAYRGKDKAFLGRNLVACDHCGFVRIDPMLTLVELGDYYGRYWGGRGIDGRFPLFEAQANARVEFLKNHTDGMPKRVLDVGAGYGFMQPALAQVGADFIYDTVETDPDAVRYLLDKQNTRRNYGDLKEVDEQYDLVILAHILEHVTDPLAYLVSIRDLLSAQGVVLFEMPNQDYLFKDHEEPHLSFFSPQTLDCILKKAGFSVIVVDTCGREFKPSDPAQQGSALKGIKQFIPGPVKRAVKRLISGEKVKEDFSTFTVYGGQRVWLRALVRKGGHEKGY